MQRKRLFHILPSVNSPHFREIFRGMRAYVKTLPDWYIDQNYSYRFDDFPGFTAHLQEKEYQALVSYAHYPEEIEFLLKLQKPTALLSTDICCEQLAGVYEDSQAIGRQMVEHLYSCGYRNIAMLNQDEFNSWRRTSIYNSVLQACSEFHLPFDDLEFDHFYDDFDEWVHQTSGNRAFIILGREHSEHILEYALETQLKVPLDLGLISMYEYESRIEEFPGLTHLVYDAYQMGYEAARLAITSAETGRQLTDQLQFPPVDLIPGSTSLLAHDDPDIRLSLEFIQSHYTEEITVSEIAEHVGMSIRNLQRRFSEEVGISPKEMLIRHRLSVARNLLTNTDQAMPLIASHSGFNDPRYMSRLFKKHYDLSPREYRQRFGN